VTSNGYKFFAVCE